MLKTNIFILLTESLGKNSSEPDLLSTDDDDVSDDDVDDDDDDNDDDYNDDDDDNDDDLSLIHI